MKASVLRYAAIGMATMSLAGFAAASTVEISTTGQDSRNEIELKNESKVDINNKNRVEVKNHNDQDAKSGRVEAEKNTELNGVSSGNAENSNTTKTSIEVTNSPSKEVLGALAGEPFPGIPAVTIRETGQDSKNEVEIKNIREVNVTNHNTVDVHNKNNQSAESGKVEVEKNTKVGSVSSGSAKNTSNTETTIKL